MVIKKIISTLLAVLMLCSACMLVISAEEVETFVSEYETNLSFPTIDYKLGRVDFNDAESALIESPEDKLATMDCRLEKDGYRLYVDAYSGEVGIECIATGEILLTNPYDLSESKNDDWATKLQLMSQLIVHYKEISSDQSKTLYSGEWTVGKAYDKNANPLKDEDVQPSQIRVKNIKNGLRVEYTIGREQSKMLVPRVIEQSAFETKVLNPIKEALEIAREQWIAQYMAEGLSEATATSKADVEVSLKLGPMTGFYKLYDPKNQPSSVAEQMYSAYPITKKMAVYVLDTTLFTKELARIEQIIKTYAPNYTYEELDADHMLVEYVNKDKNPPLFKMALEYTLDEQGLNVRLPANGIRFTESLYELLSVEILPYMGASSAEQEGYTFFPDGSGALFDYQQIANAKSDVAVVGKVYGQDYAYHTITGAHQEAIRYPVFGMVHAEEKTLLDEYGYPVVDAENSTLDETVYKTYDKQKGFVAIVEEGDAMMELVAESEVTTSGFNTVKMRVYPRPQDTYNVADAISVGENSTWTVVSSRKYTGNYKIRYIMLTPEEDAIQKGLKNTYDTSYVGMAMAYRAYLETKGVLTRLTAEQIDANNIPLYVETFGAMQTIERFLSIPFEVMTPLTTFADVSAMYDDLSAAGINNVNFILTGYTKGGLTSPMAPYHLKWEKAVKEGGMNFEELLAVAKEKDFGIFPDFDFAFVKQDKAFDGLRLKKHAVKTIDDRYTSKREYSATKQTYISYFELALSPAYFNYFYTKLTENYLEYDPIGISVASLGSYLNSDFDEDEPYNRADAQAFTTQAFAYLSENYDKVMTSGGNAYSWKYVDYITDIALDSSRYSAAAASVPFLGIVLHGYVEFAGTPINMEGNIDYAVLKAIESGAGLQFILSYRNTANLKNDEVLSQYYSIRYNIWKDDLITLYNEVNAALKDVQTSTIVDHRFLDGIRVADNDELEADAKAMLEALIAKEKAELEAAKKETNYRILMARKLLNGTDAPIFNINAAMTLTPVDPANPDAVIPEENKTLADKIADVEAMLTAFESNLATSTALTEDMYRLDYEIRVALDAVMTGIRSNIDDYELAKEGYDILVERGDCTIEHAQMLANLNAVKATYEALKAKETALTAKFDAACDAFMTKYEGQTVDKYTYADDEAEEEQDVAVSTDSKYTSDANKIAYVKYENGTAFILNFNNYAVVVTDYNTGIVYTLEAYGYVHLKPAANA